MRSRYVWLITAAVFLLLFPYGSFNRSHIMNRFASPQDIAAAEHYFDLLRQNNIDEVKKNLDASLQGPGADSQFALMAATFPAGRMKSLKPVGFNWLREGATYTITTTLEYEFINKWLLADITTQKVRGVSTIIGMHVQPLSDSLEHANRFTLAGKGLNQYIMLFLLVFDLAFTFYAFVLCLKTAFSPGKRLLWSLISLIGVGRLGLNWTTGEPHFQLFWIGFPPAGATAAIYGPWLMYAALPLGAILFLLMRERLSRPKPRSQQTITSLQHDGRLPDQSLET
jgi:hypothetical protein